jgi:hypothetical protein
VIALHPKALDRYKRAVAQLADELKRRPPMEFATIRELVMAIIVHASPSRPGGAGTKANAEMTAVRGSTSRAASPRCAAIRPCFRTWLCRGIIDSERGTRSYNAKNININNKPLPAEATVRGVCETADSEAGHYMGIYIAVNRAQADDAKPVQRPDLESRYLARYR